MTEILLSRPALNISIANHSGQPIYIGLGTAGKVELRGLTKVLFDDGGQVIFSPMKEIETCS